MNFGPGATVAGPPARRVRRDRRAAALLPGARGLRHVSVRVSPTLAGLGTYPFVRLEQARARLRAAGVEIIDFGMGEPREETPAFIRAVLADAIKPLAPYPTRGRPARAARGDRGVGVAPLRRDAGPGHAGDPDARLQGGRVRARERLRRRRRGRADAGLPGLRARRGLRRQAGARAAADARIGGWLPDLGGRRLDRRRRAVAELPEQPDGGAGAARVLRGGGGAGARARVRARLRRGLLGALLRG